MARGAEESPQLIRGPLGPQGHWVLSYLLWSRRITSFAPRLYTVMHTSSPIESSTSQNRPRRRIS